MIPKRDVAHDIIHDALDLRLYLSFRGVGADGDVKADTGDGNLILVSDHAADRLGVPFMAVGSLPAVRPVSI